MIGTMESDSFIRDRIRGWRRGVVMSSQENEKARRQQALEALERLGRECGRELESPSDAQVYRAWFGINFNLAHTRRMLASSDPVRLAAGDIRLATYGAGDLLWNYFSIRKIRWEGEKAAVAYLSIHDPAYLRDYQQFLAETDRHRKLALYEQLAARAAAPAGGLWEEGATAIQFQPQVDWNPGIVEEALSFWDELNGAACEMETETNGGTPATEVEEDEMLPEYDFSGGVRGKHHRAMQDGYTVVIERAGGNYSAYSSGLPGCVATGETREEALALWQEAMQRHLAGLAEDRLPKPPRLRKSDTSE